MNLLDLSQDKIAQMMRKPGLWIRIGPFTVKLRSSIKKVAENMALFYGRYPRLEDDSFADFHISITKPVGPRHWIRPQAIFSFDGLVPFKPLPEDQAFAMFEWGLNWCIATTSHQFLIIHAAVVAKDDQAIILPGAPGAGKSTLCAALVRRGWRLLSDEMALIDPEDLRITPVPRPISLKNESIDLMRRYDGVFIGPSVNDTSKGTLAHMRPPTASIDCSDSKSHPKQIIFPAFSADTVTELNAVDKAMALSRTAEQCFNYNILGKDGFKTLERLISRCPVFDLGYSQLDSAIAEIDMLIS